MSIVSRPLRAWSVVFCLFATLAAPVAHAQATSGNPALEKQLSRLDLALNGIGSFTKGVSGTNYLGVPLSQDGSNTFGALLSIRYTKSPYLGGEFNYTYARYTQNYSQYIVGGAQTNASEYSVGYVAHPPHPLFGAQPFIAGGFGTTAFRPTTGGGQGLKSQARMTYYYAVGLDKDITPHFGVRAQLRQTFYKAPDFGQNYLTIEQHTWTIEPGFGFVIRF
ncbi:outer membrane beta-barrel protein [Edaphobacter aggregans]|uniref:outer membrane beta-barrel protein n=1 Tax=Edaphobacter aggregans TaxID=570835 RepID=UPI00054D5A66|nr:outer membrane beta-barrel protein [Edaphobacter aggregans]